MKPRPKKPDSIAEKLLAHRTSLKMTQHEAAKFWGISKRCYQESERGTTKPRGFGLAFLNKELKKIEETKS